PGTGRDRADAARSAVALRIARRRHAARTAGRIPRVRARYGARPRADRRDPAPDPLALAKARLGYGRDGQEGADHRHHRSGWFVPDGAAAREGLCRPRPRAAVELDQPDAHRSPPRESESAAALRRPDGCIVAE